MTKADIVVGLGYGDEGKGSIVDYLTRLRGAEYVVKYSGGHQCGHNVVLPDGKHFCFSQYGSGALAGAATILGPDFIADPVTMAAEKAALQAIGGNTKIVVTPMGAITSYYERLFQRATTGTGDNCGCGIYPTRLTRSVGIGLTWDDLTSSGTSTARKLSAIRDFFEDKMWQESDDARRLWDSGMMHIGNVLRDLYTSTAKVLPDLPIQKLGDNIIMEGGQGILLDSLGGCPGATSGRTIPRSAIEWCKIADIEYQIVGVMRSYLPRHGRGIIPGTKIAENHDKFVLAENHNTYNVYQGEVTHCLWSDDLLTSAILKAMPDVIAENHLDVHPSACMSSLGVSIQGYGPTHEDKKLVKDWW